MMSLPIPRALVLGSTAAYLSLAEIPKSPAVFRNLLNPHSQMTVDFLVRSG